jgi:hypothetical protein
MTDTGAIKVTFSPPTDTDPPTNPIWTRNQIIGINPPFNLVKDMATPYDYGAIGDGVADDTVAMQAWLDAIAGAAGYGKNGTFLVSDTLKISGNTTIYGAGRGVFIIGKQPDFPNSHDLLQNKNFVTDPSPPATLIDNNIAIYGTCFQGIGDQGIPPGTSLSSWIGVGNLTFRDCLFQHCRRFLTAFSNCHNVNIVENEFYDWASSDPVPSPGACLFDGGYAMWINGTNSNFNILNNYIHDGEWTAILLDAPYSLMRGNHIERCKEAGMFGGPSYCLIDNNKIISVRTKDCSGQGIECAGNFFTISNNLIFDTDRASIYVGECSVVNIVNNICLNPDQNMVVADPPNNGDTGAITLAARGAGPVPSTVLIANNQCSGRDGKASFGIALYNFIGTPEMTGISILGNNLGPQGAWRGGLGQAIFTDAACHGVDYMQRDNSYDIAADRSAVNFFIESGSSGLINIAGVGFKPRSIDFRATIPTTVAPISTSIGSAGTISGWDIATQMRTAGPFFASTAIQWATDATDFYSSDSSGIFCVNIRAADGTPICQAAVDSFTDDGFVMLITGVTTARVIVTAICYP